MAVDHDQSAELAERVRAARGILAITGSGSKRFYTGTPAGEALDVSSHRGIVEYEPTELVITARAGTPLAEIEAALAARGQMLAFEPPHFDAAAGQSHKRGSRDSVSSMNGTVASRSASASESASPRETGATLGGTIACGFSGPRRPYAGSARDFVLGTRIINGRGEALRFGGKVMKNVAGYDVARLMTGSLGTLGVILEVSLKVLPKPATEMTLGFDVSAADAIASMNRWAGQPLPLSAAAHSGETLHVRLSGAESAVRAAHARLGGEVIDHGERYWEELREHRRVFFQTDEPLWRLSVPPATAPLDLPGKWLIDWGGAQRWLVSSAPPATIRAAAAAAGGYATAFRNGLAGRDSLVVYDPVARALQRRIQQALDPAGRFRLADRAEAA